MKSRDPSKPTDSSEAPTQRKPDEPSSVVSTVVIVSPEAEARGPGRPGAAGTPTTLRSESDDGASPREAQRERLSPTAYSHRYLLREPLGVGGMGEVYDCHDRRIGRDVALKLLQDRYSEHDELSLRFEREAKIQARLEHPGVVPVYDIGVRDDGAVYFTMKRVHGLTLEQIVARIAAGDEQIGAKYTRRRLLTAFSSLCLAVAYGHSRGVVHRDLKPGNVILGDFGEVNVLDWGVAKPVGDPGDGPVSVNGDRSSHTDASTLSPEVQVSGTAVGAVVGTPGYMAPEQVRGDSSGIDPRTDVYALGAILFELLALESLHPRAPAERALVATVTGASDPRPSTRRPDLEIPPELDAICERATAVEPKERFATARELSEAIEKFLDGDRDVERRRQLALEHTDAARALLDQGVGSQARVEALRELNAALALDPTNARALRAMAKVVTQAPEELPPDAEEELAQQRASVRRRAARMSFIALAAAWVLLPLSMFMGIKNWWLSAPFFLSATGVMLSVWHSSRTGRSSRAHTVMTAVLAESTAASTSVLFGPFVIVPALAVACAVTIIVNSRADRMTRAYIILAAMAAITVPIGLELAGVLPHSYAFTDGVMTIEPWAAHFTEIPSLFMLWTAASIIITLSVGVIGRTMDNLSRAERRQFAQAWQLRQIFPEAARPTAPPPSMARR